MDIKLPLIGHLSLQRQIRILILFMLVSLIFGGFFVWLSVDQEKLKSLQTQIIDDALIQLQRVDKSAPHAIQGNAAAWKEFEESHSRLTTDLNLLEHGGTYQGYRLKSAGSDDSTESKNGEKIWLMIDHNATTILALKEELTTFEQTLRKLMSTFPVLFELSEEVAAKNLQHSGSPSQIAASSQLPVLLFRLEHGIRGIFSIEVVDVVKGLDNSPEIASSLKKDTTAFSDLVNGLVNGSDTLALTPINDSETRKKLMELQTAFPHYQQLVLALLSNVQNYFIAKQAGQLLSSENEGLRMHLASIQTTYRNQSGLVNLSDYLMYFGFVMALLAAYSITLVLLQDTRLRAKEAAVRRVDADVKMKQAQMEQVLQRDRDTKQINDQNQAAILRLMNELQEVADGDLTVHATVSDDITGAIADSVNYTVEELRSLVGRVATIADQVALASNQMEEISTVLLNASQQQSHEVSVVMNDVAQRIACSGKTSWQIDELVKIGQAVSTLISDATLPEIRQVSTQLADVIEEMSELAQQQAISAKTAEQHSLHVENIALQIQDGAQQTAQSIRGLSGLTQELKNAVSRFRVTV